jgi:hypothetical protein
MKQGNRWSALLTLCWLPTVAVGQRPSNDRPDYGIASSPAPHRPPAPVAPATSLLFKRTESIDWTDQTFEGVIKWLREVSDDRVNVIPRWDALAAEGVGIDSLVTIRLNDTTVAGVLNEALGILSRNGEARYRAEGNTLTISTRADFERKLYTKVYDATDLAFRVPNFGQSAPQVDLQNAGSSGNSGQGAFSTASTQDTEGAGPQAELAQEERLNKLRELIEQTIEPDSWDVGNEAREGGRGRIRVFNRALVVMTSIEVHEQIAGLFAYGE